MELTENQKEVVEARGNRIITIACAGSGKTSVLINRAKKLLDEGKEIYIITFTNKATNEIKKRLKANYSKAHVSTIHSLALQMFKKYKDGTSYEEYKFITTKQTFEIFKDIMRKHRIYLNYKKLMLMYNKMRDEDLRITWMDQISFDSIMYYYNEYLKENKLFDVNTIMDISVKTLKEKGVKIKCDAILVDEFQDVSPIQYKFIKFFDGAHFYVGDPNQSIYAFRGADMKVISQVNKSKKYKKKNININFRSRKKIIEYAYKYIFEPFPIKYTKKGGKVKQEIYDKYDEKIMEKIMDLADDGYTILMRWNRNIKKFKQFVKDKVGEDKLKKYNILTIHKAKGLEFPKVCVLMDESLTRQNIEEEMRVLHVAATRAEDELVVFIQKKLFEKIEELRKKIKIPEINIQLYSQN